MAKLTDGQKVHDRTPCNSCRTTGGLKMEWTNEAGARVVLCRYCFYVENARGSVVDDLMLTAGFTMADTAGGCNGYRYEDDTGSFLLTGFGWYVDEETGQRVLSHEEATNVPESLDEHICVGRYGKDGDYFDEKEFPNLLAALAVVGDLAGVKLVPVEHEGRTYVVVMKGERDNWTVAGLDEDVPDDQLQAYTDTFHAIVEKAAQS